MRNGYIIEKKGLLFDQDLENISETFKTKYDEFTDGLITKGNKNRDTEKKRFKQTQLMFNLFCIRYEVGLLEIKQYHLFCR